MARNRQRDWRSDDEPVEADSLSPRPLRGKDRRVDVPRMHPTDPAVEEILTSGDLVSAKAIPWGSNYSFVVALGRNAEPECLAVYKPRQGEIPLWDFPDGTLFKREYAAYRVALALGMRFIPPVVIREGPHGIGTFQLFVEQDEGEEYYAFRDQHATDLQAIALFDSVTNNADRKAGHCFKGRDGGIWGIDHGLTFNVVPKLRTVIWDFCGQLLPDDLAATVMDLATSHDKAAALRTELYDLLHPSEIEAFFARLERIADRCEFPTLDPHRNVPRGFF